VDLSKLKTSDWVVAGSAIVLLIASFMDWFKIEIFGARAAGNGWDVGFLWGRFPVLIGIAMVVVVAIKAFSPSTKLPDLPIGWGLALFIGGCVAAALVILKLIIGEDANSGGLVEFDRAFGIFLAALAAIGLAVGGFLKWQEEKSGAGVAGPGTTPPSPF
jgi:hypothetical protein